MSDVQSHMARHVARAATSEGELKAMAARAWHDFGILLMRPNQFENELDQQTVRSLGDRLYGRPADG